MVCVIAKVTKLLESDACGTCDRCWFGFCTYLALSWYVYMSVSPTKLRTPQGKTPGLVLLFLFLSGSTPLGAWLQLVLNKHLVSEWTNDGRNKASEVESNSTACTSKADCKWSSFSPGHISAARAGHRNTAILFLISTRQIMYFFTWPLHSILFN